jgi:hypothetical protein
MQELGVWTTAEGTTPARLQLESEEALPAWASGALQGAAAGAATGAAGGPYAMLFGAAVGAGLGAAAATTTPTSPSPAHSAAPATGAAPTTPAAGGGSSRAKAILALQQFAAAVPVLVQLVAASGGAKEFGAGDNGGSFESLQEGDWGPESFQGTWTLP